MTSRPALARIAQPLRADIVLWGVDVVERDPGKSIPGMSTSGAEPGPSFRFGLDRNSEHEQSRRFR